MNDWRTDPETFTVTVSVVSLGNAITAALLKANDHNAACVTTGCPVGDELADLGERAAPEALAVLLGVAE